MKMIALVLLAGGVLGFALSQMTLDRSAKVVITKPPTSITARSDQDRTARRATQVERSSRKRNPFDTHSLRTFSDWHELDLNPLTIARILNDIGKLNESDILALFTNPALLNSDSEISDQVIETAVIRWVELVGPRAFHDLKTDKYPTIIDEVDTMEVIPQGFGLWTLAQPDEARLWFVENLTKLNEQEESDLDLWDLLDEEDLLVSFIRNHERARKGKTRELISLIPSEEGRELFQEALAQAQVDQENQPEALKEMLGHEDSILQQVAIEKLLGVDPLFARDWISKQVPSEGRDLTIADAARLFVSDDFEEGSRWFLQQELVTAEARSDRLATLVAHLANNQDSERAVNLLEQQPDTIERDEAEVFMARKNLGNRNFEESIKWISGISDSKRRAQFISEILSAPNSIISGRSSRGVAISHHDIDAILNSPSRTSSEFIGTVDRVHIPGIPVLLSESDLTKFREAAEGAGLILPEQKDSDTR